MNGFHGRSQTEMIIGNPIKRPSSTHCAWRAVVDKENEPLAAFCLSADD